MVDLLELLAVLVEPAALLLVPAEAFGRAAARPLLGVGSQLDRGELFLQLAHLALRSIALIRQRVVRRRHAEEIPPAARRRDGRALCRSSPLRLLHLTCRHVVAIWVAARRRVVVDLAPQAGAAVAVRRRPKPSLKARRHQFWLFEGRFTGAETKCWQPRRWVR